MNRYLVEGLARVGYGEPFVVENQKDGDEVVAKQELVALNDVEQGSWWRRLIDEIMLWIWG